MENKFFTTYPKFEDYLNAFSDDSVATIHDVGLIKILYEVKEELDTLKRDMKIMKVSREEYLSKLYNENWY